MERATGLVSPIRHRRPRLPRSSVRSPRCASAASRSTAGRYSATWPLAREPAGGHTRTAARARAAASVATPTATRTSSRLWCAPTHLATAPHRHRPSPPPPSPPPPSPPPPLATSSLSICSLRSPQVRGPPLTTAPLFGGSAARSDGSRRVLPPRPGALPCLWPGRSADPAPPSCAASGRAWQHLGDAEAGSLAAQPPPQLLEPASPKVADLTAFGPLGPVPPPVVFDALHAVLSAPSMARALLRLCWLLVGRAAQSLSVAVGVLAAPRVAFGAAA